MKSWNGIQFNQGDLRLRQFENGKKRTAQPESFVQERRQALLMNTLRELCTLSGSDRLIALTVIESISEGDLTQKDFSLLKGALKKPEQIERVVADILRRLEVALRKRDSSS